MREDGDGLTKSWAGRPESRVEWQRGGVVGRALLAGKGLLAAPLRVALQAGSGGLWDVLGVSWLGSAARGLHRPEAQTM